MDLPPGQTSGLAEAVRLLEGIEGIAHVAFTAADVIRHELVARIVEAYDKAAARKRERPEMRPCGRATRSRSMCSSSPTAGRTRQGQIARAARRSSRRPPRCQQAGAELAIVLTDDLAIRALNRDWRGIDKATNVLSFPTKSAGGEPPLLGDIVLAYETIAREARAERKPFAHHVAHLAVHGFLHLFGYDHERDEDAEAMEQVERKILRRLAIPDPYRRPAKACKPTPDISR